MQDQSDKSIKHVLYMSFTHIIHDDQFLVTWKVMAFQNNDAPVLVFKIRGKKIYQNFYGGKCLPAIFMNISGPSTFYVTEWKGVFQHV